MDMNYRIHIIHKVLMGEYADDDVHDDHDDDDDDDGYDEKINSICKEFFFGCWDF